MDLPTIGKDLHHRRKQAHFKRQLALFNFHLNYDNASSRTMHQNLSCNITATFIFFPTEDNETN